MDKLEKRIAIPFTLIGFFLLSILFLLMNNGDSTFFIVFTSLGLVFLIIGLSIIFYSFKREKKTKKIISKGKKLYFDSSSIKVKQFDEGNFLLKIKYQDPVSNDTILFESISLPYNPQAFIENKKITVYHLRGDVTQYRIDMSFLPKLIKY